MVKWKWGSKLTSSPQGSMKQRLGYSPEQQGSGNSQTRVTEDQDYEDEKDTEKTWAE